MPPAPPPPPPPPPPAVKTVLALPPAPKPPIVAPNGPNGSFLVELVIFNGAPFKDHWVYFVRSHIGSHIGVLIHATGDVRKGFEFEVKRSHNFLVTLTKPTTRIPLQWVDGKYFDEIAMFNNGSLKLDYAPCSGFEASAYKVKAPEKTLNAVDDTITPGKKITQRNCQTWIVEAADQLVADGIFSPEVAAYLHAVKQ